MAVESNDSRSKSKSIAIQKIRGIEYSEKAAQLVLEEEEKKPRQGKPPLYKDFISVLSVNVACIWSR